METGKVCGLRRVDEEATRLMRTLVACAVEGAGVDPSGIIPKGRSRRGRLKVSHDCSWCLCALGASRGFVNPFQSGLDTLPVSHPRARSCVDESSCVGEGKWAGVGTMKPIHCELRFSCRCFSCLSRRYLCWMMVLGGKHLEVYIQGFPW